MRRMLMMSVFFCFIPSWFIQSCLAAEENNLPSLGDSSSSMISPAQEYEMGRRWLRQLRGSISTVSDPIVQDYLENLSYKLAFHSPLQQPDFSLAIIRDTSINAFAAPGGIIGINVGLLIHAETESEAAAVLSHELGHLSQRHYARQLSDQKQNPWIYLSALLASIALATQGQNDGAIALGLGVQAATIEKGLSYSRLYEQEADRIGMQTLVDSGFDPKAMPIFFERLEKESRQVGNVPEFLMTHPLTASRIADSYSRAQKYSEKYKSDSLSYQLSRVRFLINYMSGGNNAISSFESLLKNNQEDHQKEKVFRLGLSLAYLRENQVDNAEKTLQPLLQGDDVRIDYLIAGAEIDLANKKPGQAIKKLEPRLALSPDNIPLILYLSKAYIAAKQPKNSIALLEKLSYSRPDDPQVWRSLHEAYVVDKNSTGAYRSQAEIFFLTGQNDNAIQQLVLADKSVTDNYPLTAKIKQRIDFIQRDIKEMKK